MSEFKVGDEVICVFSGPWSHPNGWFSAMLDRLRNAQPILGSKYTLSHVALGTSGQVLVDLAECPAGNNGSARMGWDARCFRKVQRRNIDNWLSLSTDFEEPKKINQEEKA